MGEKALGRTYISIYIHGVSKSTESKMISGGIIMTDIYSAINRFKKYTVFYIIIYKAYHNK